ncbi:hypothetical protein MUP77_10735 [Candidatus Bathyarchaeota archaeon]|nr:hypothetical protein [Candidatus Bathyarchaeota archaeon]
MATKKTKTAKSAEPCPKCVTDTAMGFFFKICGESLSDKIDCKKLSGQYLRGEINADQVAEKIRATAGNDPELMEDLKEIDRIRRRGKI